MGAGNGRLLSVKYCASSSGTDNVTCIRGPECDNPAVEGLICEGFDGFCSKEK
jgi:hypothetical protein